MLEYNEGGSGIINRSEQDQQIQRAIDTRNNLVQEQMEKHWDKLSLLHGKPLKKIIQHGKTIKIPVPRGFVVDANPTDNLDEQFDKEMSTLREHIKRPTIPLKIEEGGIYESTATNFLHRAENQLSPGIIYLIVRDNQGDWIQGFVSKEDIRKPENELEHEYLDALRQGDYELAGFKHRACLVVSPEIKIEV